MATTMQKHTITAFYESRDYADRAADKLRASGIPASDVTVSPDTAQGEYGAYGDDRTATEAPRKSGFWASLEDMFGGTDDHHTYAEGVRRGHVLLTAHVTDAQLDRAIAVVEEHGSIDLDEHEETWRSEGWTGAPAASTSTTSSRPPRWPPRAAPRAWPWPGRRLPPASSRPRPSWHAPRSPRLLP